jgi:hypothetical protein
MLYEKSATYLSEAGGCPCSMARSPDGPMIPLSPPTCARLTDKHPPAAHNKLKDTSIYRRPNGRRLLFVAPGRATMLFENWWHFPTRFAFVVKLFSPKDLSAMGSKQRI